MSVREEIEAAIADYTRIFPVPYSLAPNLELASRALAELHEAERQLALKKRSVVRLSDRYVEAERARQTAIREAKELIGNLVDPDSCDWDHNHSCQAHGYFYIPQGEKCPNQAGKDWVSET